MIAMYLLPVFIGGYAWVTYWLLRWLRACHPVFEKKPVMALIIIIVYACLFAMYIAAVLPKGKVEKFFRIVGYYWYGVSVYIIIIFLTAMLIRLIVLHTSLGQADILSDKRFLPIVGLVCVVTMAVICIGGHYHAKKLQTTNYEVTINKSCDLDELNLVLVADQHLGYNIGGEMMTQMVEKINACQPDLVVVAGDIFDNCFENIEEPEKIAEILKGIQSKYGVYA
ncbi:MAG: metallophosphoesterase, partial [Lachnospiraceae bacterium]|nr:metallophosphoesterase [Candidatus Equihabitans merdae]